MINTGTKIETEELATPSILFRISIERSTPFFHEQKRNKYLSGFILGDHRGV